MAQLTLFDAAPPPTPSSDPLRHLLKVRTVYYEPAVLDHERGREVLAKHPDAERVEVPGHWNIPGLHGNEGNVSDWNRVKGTVLVLGVKKGMTFVPNGRSADFIAPSTANGCVMSCAYCYVPRAKGYANPLSVFVNIGQVCSSVRRHAAKLGPKLEPNSVDPRYWVYDVGCNSDCSADAAVSDNVRDLVRLFRDEVPNGMASFATKLVNRDLLAYDPGGKTRVRFSLMPAARARLLDVRTSPVADRIAAVDDFVDAGYEVHLNFSPVVVYDGWQAEYDELFRQVDDGISDRAKRQLACEVIFLTHNERLHQVNLGWHPKAEELLWTPHNQERKVSEGGGVNLRYASGLKGRLVAEFRELLHRRMPYCKVRYAF
jgi:spore photoproduct lyase